MTGEHFLIMVGAIVVSYPLAHAWLLRATESTRLKFANAGRELLVDPIILEEHKELVSDMLDDVFSWQFMARATVYFPVAVFSRGDRDLSSEDKAFLKLDKVESFFNLHMRCAMAASPIWTMLFLIVAALTVAVVIAFVGFAMIYWLWADTVKHVSPNVHPRTF